MKKKFILFLSLVCFGSFFSAKAQDCPPNMDFELGNTSVWNYFIGTCCPISTPTATAAVVNRHTLTSGAATDPYGGFPIVSPGGGSYSLRLGNDNTGSEAEKARYYIHVPSTVSNYSLIYRYAIVLQDGGSTHSAAQQPRFDVNAYDSATSAPVSCAQYHYVAGSAIPGFLTSPSASDVRYKTWTTGSINLSGLGGTTVAIDFASGDCDLGGHFGYGYLDMSCGLFQISSVGCDDTNVVLTAPDGFSTYTWYDSSTFAAILGTTQTVTLPMPPIATTYAVVLNPYAGFGCPDTLYTHVRPSHLRLNGSHDTSICFGNPITITCGATDVALPLVYSWTPAAGLSCTSCASPIASPTVNTAYIVTVTNNVGCVKSDTINITQGHVTVTTTQTNVSCFGYNDGSATVTPTTGRNPFTYAWTTAPPQLTATAGGLLAGTYSVTVSDSTGCTGDATVTITQPVANIITITGSTPPTTCGGTEGTITLSGLTAGTSYTVNYTFNGTPVSVTLVASATGTVTITGLAQGTITNIGISGTPCPFNVVGPVNLADPTPPATPIVGSNSPLCEGATLNLTALDATPGVSYSWSGPAGFSSGLQNPSITPAVLGVTSGVYVVTVTVNNCKIVGSTNVVVKPLRHPTAGNNWHVCAGDSVLLTSFSDNGTDIYSWSGPLAFSSILQNPNIPGATVAASGVYTVTMILNGCLATATTNVVVNPIPPSPTVTDTDYCQYATAIPLHAIGSNLIWYTSPTDPGSTTPPLPSTLVPGTTTWYVNQITDSGCVGPKIPTSVRVYKLESPYMTLSDSVFCLGSAFTATAVNVGEDHLGLTWEFGNGDSILNVDPVVYSYYTPGTFTIRTNINYNICPDVSLTKTVTVLPMPYINIGEDTTICPGNASIELWDHNNIGNSAASWLWSTGQTTGLITITTPGLFFVTVTINGCSASDSLTVGNDCYMALPNVFTPNGDGVNDYFFPREYLTKGLTEFKMEIFNRWGEMIFSTTRTDGLGWDGKFNGVPQPEGVFIYKMDATFKDGVREHHQSNFTLLR